ncbi:ABC-2 type transport system permease protein [Sphingomonas vulcanisoli]|uniref:Transport permease protein n=1 Tax=Sphingomonas vulcanisoli TaxID=1658060 RepID=A0ABX0TQM9_9SPHN|nr:ABC transporter permease [Sphingomonas vulcanisoli]NIJ07034.1 ABC-2 type transport system permease protein [Sphingomonas vulcanisoli]
MPETSVNPQRPAPGVPVIPVINWGGLSALYVKEVRRFFKVQLQTVWAPAFSALLLLTVFSIAFGRSGQKVMGVPFGAFAAPGLIAMAIMQAAFANASFSLLVGKMQGTIVDYLMPPLSSGELLAALTGAAMTRAILVGLVLWMAMLFWPETRLIPVHPLIAILFGLLGALMLSLLGVLTSIWADKFDHNATVTNFIVQPLSLLSGTFYSIEGLHGAFRAFSHANPFFYVISGFRYGVLGSTDSNVATGSLVLVSVNVVLGVLCYVLLRRGWKLKN